MARLGPWLEMVPDLHRGVRTATSGRIISFHVLVRQCNSGKGHEYCTIGGADRAERAGSTTVSIPLIRHCIVTLPSDAISKLY